MTLLFLFALAVIFTSFCLYAINRTQTVLMGGEKHHCDSCSFPLQMRDIVPVYSWLSLGGSCRYCHQPISKVYLLLELMAFAFIIATGSVLGFTVALLLLGLCLIAVSDLKLGLIPTVLVVFCGLLAVFSMSAENFYMALGFYAGGRLLCHFFENPPLGRGDIKFLAMSGLWLTFAQLPLFLILTGLGGMVTAALLPRRSIPLGPALCVALAISVLVGKEIQSFEQLLGFLPFFS